MFERLGVFGFVLYLLIVGGAIALLIHATSQIAEYAVASRAPETTPPATRVAVGLEAQQRASAWQPISSVPQRPSEPPISAAELAKRMDDAENHSVPNAKQLVPGPSVAGWSKSIDRKKPLNDESPARLIVRSLRAEL